MSITAIKRIGQDLNSMLRRVFTLVELDRLASLRGLLTSEEHGLPLPHVEVDHTSYTLLHICSLRGSVLIMTELLGLGMDANIIDTRGNTAVHYAKNGTVVSRPTTFLRRLRDLSPPV